MAYNPALKVSMAEAMTVACPKCYVPAHKRCVYLLGAKNGSVAMGGPMDRCHPARARAARRLQYESLSHRSVRRALQEFDRREYEALREWLNLHGSLFKHTCCWRRVDRPPCTGATVEPALQSLGDGKGDRCSWA